MAVAMGRKYQMVRVKAGDYLLPSNDRKVLWRIYRYEEDGSAEILTNEGYVPLRGWFWCAAKYAHPSGNHWSWEGDEDILEWDRWEPWETTMRTRDEAIQSALSYEVRS